MVSPSKLSHLSLIHFPIFLFHASMHCWKYSSGMLLISDTTPSKRISMSLGKRKSYLGKNWWIRRCSSRSGTTGCSEHSVLLPLRPIQIFGDNLSNTVLYHVQLICVHSNCQPLRTTRLNRSKLTSVLLLKASHILESTFTFSRSSWNLSCHTKTCALDKVLSP